MINCYNGRCHIEGDAGQILLNYLQITDELLTLDPELVIEVFAARTDILESKLTEADAKKMFAYKYVLAQAPYKEEKQ